MSGVTVLISMGLYSAFDQATLKTYTANIVSDDSSSPPSDEKFRWDISRTWA
jgi:hypothetical protein